MLATIFNKPVSRTARVTRIAAAALAVCCAIPASAQYPNQPKGERKAPREPERGSFEGRVESVNRLSGNGRKLGNISINKLDEKRSMTMGIDSKTQISIRGSNLPDRKVASLLTPGVNVRVDWFEDREARTMDEKGRWATTIIISAEDAEGTVTSFTDRQVTVIATPRKPTAYERDEPPKLRAGGRTPPKANNRMEGKPAKPQRLVCRIDKELTKITLDGKEATIADLAPLRHRRKTDPPIKFEGFIVSGSKPIILELHIQANGLTGEDNKKGMGDDYDDKGKGKGKGADKTKGSGKDKAGEKDKDRHKPTRHGRKFGGGDDTND